MIRLINRKQFIFAIVTAIILGYFLPINHAEEKTSPAQPMHRESTKNAEGALSDPILKASIVFTATLDKVIAGPVAQSYPPIYSHQLKFTIKEVFRGELSQGEAITGNHQSHQHKPPQFPEQKLCLVTASHVRGSINIDFIKEATDDLLQKANIAAKTPLGWTIKKGKLISPWASLENGIWPKTYWGCLEVLRCSETERPALMVGKGIKFTVQPVPPEKSIKWTNPDGDGLYELAVKNTTKETLNVPALLTAGDRILWSESIVILCQNNAHPVPGFKAVPATVKPLTLKPGQSASGKINVFGLRNIEWPRGGYRIDFLFALGEKSVKQSFYYMSRHHEKIREEAEAELNRNTEDKDQ